MRTRNLQAQTSERSPGGLADPEAPTPQLDPVPMSAANEAQLSAPLLNSYELEPNRGQPRSQTSPVHCRCSRRA